MNYTFNPTGALFNGARESSVRFFRTYAKFVCECPNTDTATRLVVEKWIQDFEHSYQWISVLSQSTTLPHSRLCIEAYRMPSSQNIQRLVAALLALSDPKVPG